MSSAKSGLAGHPISPQWLRAAATAGMAENQIPTSTSPLTRTPPPPLVPLTRGAHPERRSVRNLGFFFILYAVVWAPLARAHALGGGGGGGEDEIFHVGPTPCGLSCVGGTNLAPPPSNLARCSAGARSLCRFFSTFHLSTSVQLPLLPYQKKILPGISYKILVILKTIGSVDLHDLAISIIRLCDGDRVYNTDN